MTEEYIDVKKLDETVSRLGTIKDTVNAEIDKMLAASLPAQPSGRSDVLAVRKQRFFQTTLCALEQEIEFIIGNLTFLKECMQRMRSADGMIFMDHHLISTKRHGIVGLAFVSETLVRTYTEEMGIEAPGKRTKLEKRFTDLGVSAEEAVDEARSYFREDDFDGLKEQLLKAAEIKDRGVIDFLQSARNSSHREFFWRGGKVFTISDALTIRVGKDQGPEILLDDLVEIVESFSKFVITTVSKLEN